MTLEMVRRRFEENYPQYANRVTNVRKLADDELWCIEYLSLNDDELRVIYDPEMDDEYAHCNIANDTTSTSDRYPWGEKPDMVSHPPHYQSETGMEVIDVIEAFTFDLKGIEATDTGNIIKYILRWPHKNGLEDLKKAQWYLNHLITHIEKLEKEND
jgi:hypothetical protein